MKMHSSDYKIVPYSMKRVDDSVIIQDIESGNVHELNDTAFMILESCKQMLTENQNVESDTLAQLLMKKFQLPENFRKTIFQDVEIMLNEFMKVGLIVRGNFKTQR